MRIVFMGTPDFAAESLRALAGSRHEVVLAVSQPDAAKDRGKKIKPTPVRAAAEELGIPVFQPAKITEEAISEISAYSPDIIAVTAYGKILPKALLDMPRFGCINAHASILPRHRGSAPMQHAILKGDRVTGVTIMQMDEGMDTGDMLLKEETPVGEKDLEQLHDELAEMGGRMLVSAIDMIEKGEAEPEKQDDEKATYAPMISKKDGLIDFTRSAKEIERKVRAYRPWPGAYTYFNDEMLKVWKASVVPAEDEAMYAFGDERPGGVTALGKDGIAVQTGNGVLLLTEVQSPGKRRMQTSDWLRGKNVEIHTVLGYNKG